MSLNSISQKDIAVTVSSTFDKASKKENLLDGNNETCWSSQQGLPQSISFNFSRLLPVSHLAVTFQGGFSGTTMEVWMASQRPGKEAEQAELGLVFGGKLYPKDSNGRQVFELPIPAAHANTFHQKGLTLESPSSNPLSSSPSSTPASAEQAEKDWLRELKLVFEKSADPWGRIVVYGVELLSDHRGEF